MKCVCWAVLWFVIGLIIGFVAVKTETPTVHECMSVCLEYVEGYDDTIDYD